MVGAFFVREVASDVMQKSLNCLAFTIQGSYFT